MQNLKPKEISLKTKVDRFIFNWHLFPVDYWWRKKYNIPFGSSAHREMNFIDMLIEYREELLLSKAFSKNDSELSEDDEKSLGLYDDSENNIVKMSSEDIDDEYEKLDLEQFDKQ